MREERLDTHFWAEGRRQAAGFLLSRVAKDARGCVIRDKRPMPKPAPWKHFNPLRMPYRADKRLGRFYWNRPTEQRAGRLKGDTEARATHRESCRRNILRIDSRN